MMNLTTPEQRLRSTARLAHQSMWLLFLIAAGLMLVVRRSATVGTGSTWIVACAVLALMFSFALRDVVKKLGHRHTEDRIVRDVKVFLESEPALPVMPPVTATARAAADDPPIPADGVPSKPAGFVPVNCGAAYSVPTADPVVFDAFPLRAPVAFQAPFFAVLLPVVTN